MDFLRVKVSKKLVIVPADRASMVALMEWLTQTESGAVFEGFIKMSKSDLLKRGEMGVLIETDLKAPRKVIENEFPPVKKIWGTLSWEDEFDDFKKSFKIIKGYGTDPSDMKKGLELFFPKEGASMEENAGEHPLSDFGKKGAAVEAIESLRAVKPS